MSGDPFIASLMAQVDAQVTRDALRGGVMTLGGLRTALAMLPSDTAVEFEDGTAPDAVDSYRGYYERLAFSRTRDKRTAAEVIAVLDAADGDEFHGYKGGSYFMDSGSFLHIAEYGDCGPFVSGLHLDEDRVVIEATEETW